MGKDERSYGLQSPSIRPRTLIVSFRDPIGTFVSDEAFIDRQGGDLGDVNVNDTRWYREETPLAVPGDILYERHTRLFIGMAFEITWPEWELPAALRMLDGLDPAVIRVTDYSDPATRSAYPESCRSGPYLEVRWHPCADYVYETGQVLFGAWAFGYPTANPSLFQDLPWTPPCGMIVIDIQERLKEFHLRFPERLSQPKLNVKPV